MRLSDLYDNLHTVLRVDKNNTERQYIKERERGLKSTYINAMK